MAYLGKVERQRNFKVASYVLQLDPKGYLGIRKVNARCGFIWYNLADLCTSFGDKPSLQVFNPSLLLPPGPPTAPNGEL
jgi:hypothetical protein